LFDAEITIPRPAHDDADAATVAEPWRGSLHDAGDPYIGSVLKDRFRIERKLGEGGFGAVYGGSQTGTNRAVAIKLLHPEMTRDQNVVARFRREGQVLCNLRDAHTITTYDFDRTEDGTLFIAMELLEGRSLHDVFHTEAPIEWRRMVKIVAECCSSLAEAHIQGIIHRDLKPENIHLENRPGNPEFVKILDFGIAKVVHGEGFGKTDQPQLTATGQTLGTLEYMSPEQLMGKPLDGRSDIYGLGVVAYELLTGQLPFPEATGPAALIAAQLKSVPRPPSQVSRRPIPPPVDALIRTMLEKHKESRYADVDALRIACRSLLDRDASQPAIHPPPPASYGGPGPEAPRSPMPAMAPPMNLPDPGQSFSPPVGPRRGSPPPVDHSRAGYSGTEMVARQRGPAQKPSWMWIALAVVALAGLTAVGIILALS
jgi:serine/threonine-protein kinase